MKKRGWLLGWLLALCLCVGLLVPPAAAASDIFFTAVNDTLLPLTADTMPYRSGGILYVPYTVFDSNSSGVSLGVSCTYNRNRNTVILYNNRQVLTFYLDSGICYDEMTGDTYSRRAALHNGVPFVALDTVCRFLDLEYTYNIIPQVPQSYLVRVKNGEEVLNDPKFIDAASNWIDRRYQTYLQSLPSAEAPGSTGEETPGPGQEEPEPHQVPTYLAVLCGGEDVSGLLDGLLRGKAYGVFFVTPELVEREDDLIRHIAGMGHSVGIWAEGDDLEATRAILEEGERLLEALTYSRTTLAYVPKEQRGQLEQEGWICWDETMRLAPSAAVGAFAYSDRILNQLEGRSEDTCLTLEGGPNAGRILSALLRRLQEEHFVVSLPLETRL